MLVEVAVAAPLRRTFTYRAEDPRALEPGRRLLVPFGARKAIGFSLGKAREAPPGETRDVLAVLDEAPVLPADLLELLRFAADYYLHPLGDALRTALPPDLGRVRQGKERPPPPNRVELAVPPEAVRAALAGGEEPAAGALRRAPRQAALVARLLEAGGALPLEALRGEFSPEVVRALASRGWLRLSHEAEPIVEETAFAVAPPARLSAEQEEALRAVEGALGTYACFLLQGVTGSGKTEVYLRAIEAVRRRGEGALVLVPEIALTPQLAARFRARFGDQVAVLHSAMGEKERVREHRRLLDGEASIALGARSAVFAPVRKLGIVVVDEEYDASFKQEEKFRYHARDLAVVRAERAGIPCILGSATPSLESLENVRRGKYRRLVLSRRADGRALPEVEIVDLRAHAPPAEDEVEPLSPRLLEALRETLQKKEQALLLLNRRGHSPIVLCPTCGERASCPNCDVGLTYHRSTESLRCHYCDLRTPRWKECPSCRTELLVLGMGTERLEQSLARHLPEARIARLDRDTAVSAKKLRSILGAFARRETDVLVGTQMVAKGHDFPGVTLVGVVLADIGLGLPDFRAGERTFQLLTQVAGRAGRGDAPGRVIVQTFHPEADPIVFASRHDPLGFAEREAARRRALGYPPFRRMLAVRVEGPSPAATQTAASTVGTILRRLAGSRAQVLGPAPAPIARLRGKTRFQILVFAARPSTLRAIGNALLAEAPTSRGGVRLVLDVDPVSML